MNDLAITPVAPIPSTPQAIVELGNTNIPSPQPQGGQLALVPAKKKPKKHVPHLRFNEREARAELVLMRRLCGQRMADIEKEFNISNSTAYRALRQAREHGYLENAKAKLIGLLPKAIAVLDIRLEQDLDKEVALKVIEGLGLLTKQVKVEQSLGDNSETFEVWRAKFTRTVNSSGGKAIDSEGAGGLHGDGPVIDAEITQGDDQGSGKSELQKDGETQA